MSEPARESVSKAGEAVTTTASAVGEAVSGAATSAYDTVASAVSGPSETDMARTAAVGPECVSDGTPRVHDDQSTLQVFFL